MTVHSKPRAKGKRRTAPPDEKLVARIRRALASRADFAERRMFGGVAFLVGGRMCCGVLGEDLMVRVGPDGHEEAVHLPHARPMDFTGRPIRGFVDVGPKGVATAPALRAWIDRAVPAPR
jgi:hypothetical protein